MKVIDENRTAFPCPAVLQLLLHLCSLRVDQLLSTHRTRTDRTAMIDSHLHQDALSVLQTQRSKASSDTPVFSAPSTKLDKRV